MPADPTRDALREAAESAAIWLEAESEHPREDPRPAMRLQASILRAALTPPAADPSEPCSHRLQTGPRKPWQVCTLVEGHNGPHVWADDLSGPEVDAAWEALRDSIAVVAYELTRRPNGPSELRGELNDIIARHRTIIEAAIRAASPGLESVALRHPYPDGTEVHPQQPGDPDYGEPVAGLDVERLATAIRIRVDTTTRRRVLPFLDAIAREYAALGEKP